jgi:Carboxypeptidase regulatory-like domain/TonB dependent receptor
MRKLVLFILLVALSMMTLPVVAQEVGGTINGSVIDAQGAVVVNAEVTVTDPATGFSRKTVTGSTGNFSIPLLPPSTYTMRTQAKGFSTLEQKGIALQVGQVLTINQTLKPGATSEILEVTSEAPLIETSNSEVVGSVSPTEVASLPLLDRNFAGLETLVPGVRQAEGFDPTKTRVGNISVNGGDGRQVDTNVDGGDNKDLVVGGMVQNFTMEGIQEFNVITDHYTAEAGHSVAAVVNVISKSGTNTLHGSLFGLFQNSALNKNDYFTLKGCEANNISASHCSKALLHKYHFGGSIGGPIVKDKLFFFGAFEQKREPGALITDSAAFADLTQFAAMTQSFPGGPYAFPVRSLPSPYVDNLATAKLDYKISDRQNLSLRYGRQKWTAPNDQLGNPIITDGTQSNSDINNFHDLTITHNYTVTTNKVNSLNLHFQDMVNVIPGSPLHTFTYPVIGGGTVTNPNILLADGTSVGINANVPQQTLIRKYQFRDDFNWMHGKHNVKFGGNEIYFAKMGGYFYSQLGYTLALWDNPACIAANNCDTAGSGGLYPAGLQTPGAVQDILLNGGSGSTSQPPWHSLGLYFQDDYKMTSRFTLNLGLRWDANLHFLQSQLGSSLTDSNKGIWDLRQVMMNSAFPASDPGAQRIAEIVGNVSNLRRRTSDLKEFQPRFGFAWDMLGNGKHLLRGGYGISRDQIFQNITLWSIQQSQATIYQAVFEATGSSAPGTGCTETGTGPVAACTFRFGIDPLPTPPPATVDLAFGATPRLTNPKITDPWSQQMSFGYAWQVSPDYAFSVDYHHILGTHEERVLNMNPLIATVCDPNFGGNPANPRCVNGTGTRLMDFVFNTTGVPCVGDPVNCPGGVGGIGRFNKIYDYSTNNRSMYDGINIQLRRRMSHHMMFQMSDVISSSRSWGGFPVASYGGSGLAITPEQQFASNEFARTNFDERNRFVFSGVFELPFGIGLEPIFTAASPRPYSFLTGTDINGDGRVINDRVCVGSTLAAAITTPGCTMIKPNTLSGKAYIEMDLGIDKSFKLGERAKIQINWQFYNLFNRANFCNSYEESWSAGLPADGGTFNTPRSYCGGPSNAAFGGVSGYGLAATKSLTSQFGFRFEF